MDLEAFQKPNRAQQMRFHQCSTCNIILAVFTISAIFLISIDTSFLRLGAGNSGGEEFVNNAATVAPLKGAGYPPILAFWISGTGGDSEAILGLLKALYHPRNQYLVHLDAGCGASERIKLAITVRSQRIYRSFGNVNVVGKANAMDKLGASALAATLHGAALLLKISPDWDWLINLSASDYPILAQDDLLHVFADLPRDINFIDHRSNLGQQQKRFEDIIVDPNLHLKTNTPILYGLRNRTMPNAFKIFTGSSRVILSRSFTEHCVLSLDNLPRKLLLYFSNVVNPMQSYFQTVVCNSAEFGNSTVSSDLSQLLWHNTAHLKQSHTEESKNSKATSAEEFMGVQTGSIDRSIHGCCSSWSDDINHVKPGPLGKKLARLVSELVATKRKQACLCRVKNVTLKM